MFDLTEPVPSAPVSLFTPVTGGGWLVHLGGDRAYTDARLGELSLLDMSDPAAPHITPLAEGSWPWGGIHDVAENLAVASSGQWSSIVLLDVADPLRPRELAMFEPLEGMHVYMARLFGPHLYVCGTFGLGGSLLIIFDVADPTEPRFVTSLDLHHIADDVAVQDDYAYFALTSSVGDYDAGSPGTFLVVDVSEPTDPSVVSRMLFPRSVSRVTVSGRRAYVLTGDSYHADSTGLVIFDVYQPSSPSVRGYVPLPGWPTNMAIGEEYALVSTSDRYERDGHPLGVPSGSVRVIDLRHGDEAGQLPTGSYAREPHSMALVDGVLWIATDHTGLWAWRRGE